MKDIERRLKKLEAKREEREAVTIVVRYEVREEILHGDGLLAVLAPGWWAEL